MICEWTPEQRIDFLRKKLEDLSVSVARLWFVVVILTSICILCLVFVVSKRSYPCFHASGNGMILDVDTGSCYRPDGKPIK